MTGKEIRLGRIRDDDSGNFVTVPMDHGVTLGPVKGLNDVHETIDEIGRGGGDSVLVHKGVVEQSFDKVEEDLGVIVHLNAATSVGPDPNDKVMVGDVKRAVRLGADAVSVISTSVARRSRTSYRTSERSPTGATSMVCRSSR